MPVKCSEYLELNLDDEGDRVTLYGAILDDCKIGI